MEPFGPVIKVTGIDSEQPKRVWFSEVSIFESKEDGRPIYRVCCQKTDGSEDIDKAVREALETLVQQLTAKASPEA